MLVASKMVTTIVSLQLLSVVIVMYGSDVSVTLNCDFLRVKSHALPLL